MRAYADVYLEDVVENQGKLFDLVSQEFPDKDTEDFINAYMTSKTRLSIDGSEGVCEYDGCKRALELFR